MRILLLNWRDPMHPRAGGAEVFTYEIAKRLVSGGDSVEWFSAAVPGAPAEEVRDGIRFVRAGRQWSVHWHAFRRYHGKLRARFDVVIDQVNTIPFFTPVWADVPAFMQIHQLAREVWWYESPFPINAIGYLAEPVYLRLYRHANVLALSASTQDDLRKLRFQGPITIVPAAVEPGFVEPGQKADVPTFLYVGRLAPSKRIDHIIRAFHRFKRQYGSGQLSLIGEGNRNTVNRLHALVHELSLGQSVRFLSRVSTEEKYRQMARSHLLLMASVREGWGLSVSEANACGTPSIVYDVPGLRDAVRPEETGVVVPQSPEHMADAMLRLIRDEQLQKRLASAAAQWARTLTFDRTATILRRAIEPAERRDIGLAAPIRSAEKQ